MVKFNLGELKSVESLDLRRFQVELDEETNPFGLPKIRKLRLYQCRIQNIDSFFKLMPNLEVLDLYYLDNASSIATLIHSLSSLNNLKCFRLSADYLDEFESLEVFKGMTNLVVLKLSVDIMVKVLIDEDTFKTLENLRVLEIQAKSGNWFKYLKNLKELTLVDFNSVSDDFARINSLRKLEKLKISNYSSRRIHLKRGQFKELKELKSLSLHISVDKIESYAFEGLENLIEFEIHHLNNKFELKMDIFKVLTSLRKLCIWNAICFNEKFCDDYFRNLLDIELNNVCGFEINELTFSNMFALRKLTIISTDVQTLSENMFSSLENLRELVLVKTRLRRMSENSFNGLGKLRRLDLDGTELMPTNIFNMNILSRMPQLEQLKLDRNSFGNLDLELVKTIFQNLKDIQILFYL